MDRRKFLKRAAAGSAALGTLSMLGGNALAEDGQRRGYRFVVLSRTAGTERLIISGNGSFGSNGISGGGSLGPLPAGGAPPPPGLGAGTWEGQEMRSLPART